MRRLSPESFLFAALMVLVLALGACGGGTPTANVVNTITINSINISLNQGDTFPLSVSALDKNGNAAVATLNYTSSNTDVLTVSPAGLLCAGKWDATFIVCTPTTSTGSSTISVTAANGKSASTTAFVHFKVDVVLASGPADCLSNAETAQLTAVAKSNNPAICSKLPGAPPVPCTIPSDTLGQVTWSSNDADVVTVDNTVDKSGTATAGIPGKTTVIANVSGNNSPAITFTTCPIVSLNITAGSTTDPFSLDKSGTRSFTAVAIDSKGTTLTTAPLIWSSSQPFAMAIATAGTTITATATASNPGTAVLMASCSSPACNRQLNPVFSNVIVGTTNGTSNDTLYAASKDSLSLIPIDLTNNNTVGTAITLPQKPNSLIVNDTGSTVGLGSDSVTAMTVSTATNAVTSLNIPGVMLGFSPDGNVLGFASTVSNLSVVTLSNVGGATGAAASLPYTGNGHNLGLSFSPDTHFAFLTQQSTKLQEWNASNQVFSTTLNAPASDVAFLAEGPAAYLAGGASGQVTARATCDLTTQVDTESATSPVFVRAIPNNTGILALDPPNMIVLSPITVNNPSNTNSCPPVVSSVRNSYPTGISIPDRTKAQMLMTPDSTKAFITNGSNLVYIFDVVQHTTKPVTLTGDVSLQSFEADVTLDSRFAYIGASDGKIHKIDLVAGSDAAQIDPGLKQSDNTTVALPHFVGLRHKP